jgi:uracil-DNA glycosylase
MQAAAWLTAQAAELAGTGWQDEVQTFLRSDAGQTLCQRLDARLAQGVTICPQDPFRALKLTPRDAVQVVILGQDPYHGEGQATGLAFAVQPGVATPPSLRNIFKELQLWGPARKTDGDLTGWAEQGVLLLNTVLTVELGTPAAHAGWGWEALTDRLIVSCAQAGERVFMLWGAHAQAKLAQLDVSRHLVLMSSHPSPLSATRSAAPFMGSGAFGQANDWLSAQGRARIDWSNTQAARA